jgi:hypothetical protein
MGQSLACLARVQREGQKVFSNGIKVRIFEIVGKNDLTTDIAGDT